MTEKQIISKIENELTKLKNCSNFMRGSIRKAYLKCGKPGCKCKKPDGKGHGPYHYINISKLDKKNRSIFVPDNLHKESEELVKNYLSLKKSIERITLLNIKRFAAIKSKQRKAK